MNSSPRRTKIWRNRSSLFSKNEYTDPTENSASSATSLSVVSWKPLRPNTSSAASSELGAAEVLVVEPTLLPCAHRLGGPGFGHAPLLPCWITMTSLHPPSGGLNEGSVWRTTGRSVTLSPDARVIHEETRRDRSRHRRRRPHPDRPGPQGLARRRRRVRARRGRGRRGRRARRASRPTTSTTSCSPSRCRAAASSPATPPSRLGLAQVPGLADNRHCAAGLSAVQIAAGSHPRRHGPASSSPAAPRA